MKYEYNEEILNIVMAFLDRVDLKGHQEREAMNRACYWLMNPIKEEEESDE